MFPLQNFELAILLIEQKIDRQEERCFPPILCRKTKKGKRQNMESKNRQQVKLKLRNRTKEK
jgi:hypothetical protein